MSPSLSVVGAEPRPLTVAEKVRALQAEARALALDHTRSMAAQMADLQAMATEISEGGEAYSQGLRAVAREVAMHCASRAVILETLAGRAPGPPKALEHVTR